MLQGDVRQAMLQGEGRQAMLQGDGRQAMYAQPPGATRITPSPVMVIQPESVVVDFLPMTATIQTNNMTPYVIQPEASKKSNSKSSSSSVKDRMSTASVKGKSSASSVKGKKKLGRTGSDTVELMTNEHPVASSDSDYRLDPQSASTTNTSIDTTPSTEEIPYIDSSSDE